MSIKRTVSELSDILGTILIYGGGAGLLIMAIVGTVAIDIVILAALTKHRSHNASFLTGYLCGSFFAYRNPDPVPILIASPITTAVAIVLSIFLGVPAIGIALAAGWAIAASIFCLGLALQSLAAEIASSNESSANHEPFFMPYRSL